MIEIFSGKNFYLSTDHTTYAFRVCRTGQLEHLYYGKKIHVDEDTDLSESHTNAHGNSVLYNNETSSYSLEDLDSEAAFYGKGDIREPLMEAEFHDGSTTLDFVFASYEKCNEDVVFTGLPLSYDEKGEAETLKVTLRERNSGAELDMFYKVYSECDCITRFAVFRNTTDGDIKLKRALSLLIDFPEKDYMITTFHGGWTNEMNREDLILTGGKFVNSSFTGTSSSRSNPLSLMSKNATEDTGSVYGFNLVYSGNHYEAFEVNSFGKTRVVAGINPTDFEFLLKPGDNFEIPECLISYSDQGFNGLSLNFHNFVRHHIIRGVYRDEERPVLLNSWEANYFNIDEDKLYKLAKCGKDIGIELFVMDDGWFKGRDNDKKSLGDWEADKKKLPGGLKGIADKIHGLGMKFGIWIEPEMINVDSDLYRAHPDFAMDIPGRDHSEGRNQRLLDLANPAIVDLIIDKIENVLKSARIDYVKWDMNRIVSDVYSHYLPPERQGETLHRYVLGFYRMAEKLTKDFPNILFEGCASGGNRFDLGMLSFFPQIWASDDTDALSRMDIQNGYSYGYPQNAYTCHISSVPNHQTLRSVPLKTRADVAFFGNMGIELNLIDLSRKELQELKEEIELYKKYRKLFQYGRFYRGRNDEVLQWTVVSPDRKTAAGITALKYMHPADMHLSYFPKGLDPEKKYHFFNIPASVSVKEFGDLVNTVGLPIHVKQDSLVHNLIDKFYHMDGEKEDKHLYGDALMYSGAGLTQAYIGTGIDNVRVMKSGSSRLYFMEEEE